MLILLQQLFTNANQHLSERKVQEMLLPSGFSNRRSAEFQWKATVTIGAVMTSVVTFSMMSP
jgi:hypothetical protein